METTPDAVLAAVAQRQASAVSRVQANAAGVTDRMIGRRLARGRWTHRHPGVYTISGAPPSWEQDLWAAYLAVGRGVVSHDTSLLVHGLDDRHAPRYPLSFTVDHGDHHRVSGAIVHQIDDVLPHHYCVIDGLPVSTPARAVIDLAAAAGPKRLGDLVDVLTRRHTSIVKISACLAEIARPGKRGLATLAAVLDERGPGHVPPQSELEARLLDVISRAGPPEPRRQFALPGRGAVTGLVDAAYADVRVIVEADGRRWHTRIRDLRRDHLRDAEAARAGWQTRRFLYEEVVGDPDHVTATVADVRRERSHQFSRSTG